MDKYFKEDATKDAWEHQKVDELNRAYKFCKDRLNTPLTFEEFSKIWYSENTDKKGVHHLANMCMSIFQSRKARAGSTFENALKIQHTEHDIKVLYQVWVDDKGNIYLKKPKKISVHKVDGLIPLGLNQTNIKDMFVISNKTTIRERYRQDSPHLNDCKRVILFTREELSAIQVENLVGYGYTVVYPYAPDSENTWSYDKYFSEIKRLQNGVCDNLAK